MRIALCGALVAVALAALAAPASAVLLSLSAGTGAQLAPFRPGQTATGSGSLTATDPNPTWALTVLDTGTGAGHMVKAPAGCAGSDAQLTNPLTVTVTGSAGGITSTGSQAISATATTVASGTSALLLLTVLTTNYAQIIPPSQSLLTGCVYSLTATYTLQ
jgi:hypothetical protein